jgi:putative transcriptional regulator
VDHRGRLLVATPLIADPTFSRTVVFLLAHGRDGAFGLVVNRPAGTLSSEVMPAWEGPVTAPGVVFMGGPVTTDMLIGVARVPHGDPPGFQRVLGEIGTIELAEPPAALADQVTHCRFFAGSAGWAPGQLEDELSEGAWWPVDATPFDLFTEHPEDLWGAVLHRQAGELAWFANYPEDPTDN